MRKICVVTGSRAEYGLLQWLMTDIQSDEDLTLQIVATGMHLSPRFGNTVEQIRQDGFTIDAEVRLELNDDTPIAVSRAIGQAISGFAVELEKLKPHLVVILGDRFEALGVAVAPHGAGIPIAHLHGGEVTHGAIDEAFRHSITKMAQLHFVAAEPYRKRVIQLGERSDRVLNFGTIGLDHLSRTQFMERHELQSSLGFALDRPVLLVTFHPETLAQKEPDQEVSALLSALEAFPNHLHIFTLPNADPKGQHIANAITDYAKRHSSRAHTFTSMGQVRYLSTMRLAAAVVGNSSSGVIEAPALGVPTVNIGARQSGRLMADSVISCGPTKDEITQALSTALSDGFTKDFDDMDLPYKAADASRRIKDFLKTAPLDRAIEKQFIDMVAEGRSI